MWMGRNSSKEPQGQQVLHCRGGRIVSYICLIFLKVNIRILLSLSLFCLKSNMLLFAPKILLHLTSTLPLWLITLLTYDWCAPYVLAELWWGPSLWSSTPPHCPASSPAQHASGSDRGLPAHTLQHHSVARNAQPVGSDVQCRHTQL